MRVLRKREISVLGDDSRICIRKSTNRICKKKESYTKGEQNIAIGIYLFVFLSLFLSPNNLTFSFLEVS